MGEILTEQTQSDRTIHLATYNAVIRACRSYLATKFDGKFFSTVHTNEGTLVSMKTPESDDEATWLFGLSYTGSGFTVYDGKIQIKGAWYDVASKTEDFSGTPVYIFVNFNRSTGIGEVQQANTIQGNTTSNLFWMLAEFSGSAGSYDLVKRYHKGAIQIDLPL